MAEGQGGVMDNVSAKLSTKPREVIGRTAVEKTKGPDAELSGIYNLPAKVAGMEKRLGEISGNEHLSPGAYLKKIRKLEHRSLWLRENARLNRRAYENKFGGEAMKRLQQTLEEFPDKTKKSHEQEQEINAEKNLQILRSMGYSE